MVLLPQEKFDRREVLNQIHPNSEPERLLILSIEFLFLYFFNIRDHLERSQKVQGARCTAKEKNAVHLYLVRPTNAECLVVIVRIVDVHLSMATFLSSAYLCFFLCVQSVSCHRRPTKVTTSFCHRFAWFLKLVPMVK